MKQIPIIVTETAIIEAIADSNYMFKAVNEFLLDSGRPISHVFKKITGLTPIENRNKYNKIAVA